MLTGLNRAHHGVVLNQATQLIESGQIRPLLDERRFDLGSVHDAHNLVEAGDAVGKVVLDIAG
ncbi:zinc-binding dehydrogenase [Pseudomonas sp. CVAP|uniref:zinc-binding dehydrogenase n=1 Tax=Pseudomonas sp. CVAP\|nr:zinc-binding dehydrogenase [Pseudomonas sp. CVAP\